MSEEAKSSAEWVRVEFEKLVREGYDRRAAYARAVMKDAYRILEERE